MTVNSTTTSTARAVAKHDCADHGCLAALLALQPRDAAAVNAEEGRGRAGDGVRPLHLIPMSRPRYRLLGVQERGDAQRFLRQARPGRAWIGARDERPGRSSCCRVSCAPNHATY